MLTNHIHQIPLTPKLGNKLTLHRYHTPKHTAIIHNKNQFSNYSNNSQNFQKLLLIPTTHLDSQYNKLFTQEQKKNNSIRNFSNLIKIQDNNQKMSSSQCFKKQTNVQKRETNNLSLSYAGKKKQFVPVKNINSLKRKSKLLFKTNFSQNNDEIEEMSIHLNSPQKKNLRDFQIIECITESELTVIEPPPIFRNHKYLSKFLRQDETTSQSMQLIKTKEIDNIQKIFSGKQNNIEIKQDATPQPSKLDLFCCMKRDSNIMLNDKLVQLKKIQKRPFFN